MISETIIALKGQINGCATLVAVSKKKSNDAILEAYEAGQRDFGENYVQELCEKAVILPKDIRWHLIGHLQTNKVKYIAPFVYLIQSVDSLKLLKEINRHAMRLEKKINCLLQVHVAQEETKSGFNPEELLELARKNEFKNFPHIAFHGIMGMASFTENEQQLKEEFSHIKSIFTELSPYFGDEFKEISMGMSGDWQLAIDSGGTMVRIGSSIFGNR